MVLQTAIRERTGREITHQVANRKNTPGTAERRGDLGALLSYRRAVNALAWPAAFLDLVMRHQTLAEGPKPALLRGSAELARHSRASAVGLTTQQRWGAVGGQTAVDLISGQKQTAWNSRDKQQDEREENGDNYQVANSVPGTTYNARD